MIHIVAVLGLVCIFLAAPVWAEDESADRDQYVKDYDACMAEQDKAGHDSMMETFLSCMRAKGYTDEDLIIDEIEPGYDYDEEEPEKKS